LQKEEIKKEEEVKIPPVEELIQESTKVQEIVEIKELVSVGPNRCYYYKCELFKNEERD